MTRLLLIDDDRALLRALEIGLGAGGYQIYACQNGTDGLTRSVLFAPDLILLDLGLPDFDGIEFCHRLRSWSDVPVLILSAAGDEKKKVSALDAGADDYITKPFGMAELEARIRVAIRHSQARPNRCQTTRITVGPIDIDLEKRLVRSGGALVELTSREFDLLAYLARNTGKVFTHQQILRDVWGIGYGHETHYLRVYVNRLRNKLGEQAGRALKTNPGVGYQLVDISG